MIHETAIVYDWCKLGKDPIICEYVVLGVEPFVIRDYNHIPGKYDVKIGDNFYIGCHSRVVRGNESDTIIGNDVKVAQGVNIGHDNKIGDKVLLMNHVNLNGHVKINSNTKIMSGVTIKPRVSIGENTIIGMGSVVTHDIPDNVVAYGIPCKIQYENN